MQAELIDAPKTEIAKVQPINWELLRQQALAMFEAEREDIAKEVSADILLKVTDEKTLEAAKKRKWVWVKRRTDLDRTRKDASADAKKIVALVSDVADTVQEQFSKAEDYLAQQIEQYKTKIESERKAKADTAFNAKNSQLQHVGIELNRLVVESLTDDQIATMIEDKILTDRLKREEAERQAAVKAEADRLAAEERERHRVEAEKLAAERAAFEKQQSEAKAEIDRLAKMEADKIAADRAELERQKAEQASEFARLKAAHDEQQRKIDEAHQIAANRERERLETEQQAERDRIVATEQAEKIKVEERLKPDRDKLLAWSESLSATIKLLPEVSVSLAPVTALIADVVTEAVRKIRVIV